MGEPWRHATQRTGEFDRTAADYHRFRPRYPEALFDDILRLGELRRGSTAIEIGAGTGIATERLVDRGIDVIAVEPSPEMAAVGRSTVGAGARWVVSRFEDVEPVEPVDLIVSCNAWHWVEPGRGVDRAADLLRTGGSIALVWTEVVAWGSPAFEAAMAEAFGAVWPKTIGPVLDSRLTIQRDPRFGELHERRHRFARSLDADTYVAVTRTYGSAHSHERDELLRRLVDQAGGHVTKVEEAVLFIARRT